MTMEILDLSLQVFLVLLAAATLAAGVNGALGYGFSSVVVPISLTMVASRVLNPALVLLEVVLNSVSLWLNRRQVRAVWPHVRPILLGLVPGVIVGGFLFGVISAQLLKAGTYVVLLPVIALQSFAWRWPIRSASRSGPPFGFGLGVLYATTTVSGPPLALYFNNLGLAQDEFRAALAIVRVFESMLTLLVYAVIGALTWQSAGISLSFLPLVLLGLAAGRWLMKRVNRALFSSICMRVDMVLVTIGLAVTVTSSGWVPRSVAWSSALLFALGLHVWARLRARRSNLISA